MKQRRLSPWILVPALWGLVGCSDYWGPGPDPAAAGPFEGHLPARAGSSNGNAGNGSNCNPGPCGSGASGGSGPSGGSGGADVGMVLTSNIPNGVNDIALDDEYVYFTTGQGLARIPKEGGEPEALGGFANANGLAVGTEGVYLVEDSGSVALVATDGSKTTVIVPATFAGGSGPIVLDDLDLYYAVGPWLRRAPTSGGDAANLVGNVYQGGRTANQLAVNASFVFYVAQAMGGGSSQLRKVEKDAVGLLGGDQNARPGTLVASTQTRIPAVASDGFDVYFLDYGSDGLKSQLEVRHVAAGDKPPAVVASVTASDNGPIDNAGGDLLAFRGDLYFSGSRGLYTVAAAGGTVTTIDENAMPTAIAVDDKFLYWAEQQNGAIKRLER